MRQIQESGDYQVDSSWSQTFVFVLAAFVTASWAAEFFGGFVMNPYLVDAIGTFGAASGLLVLVAVLLYTAVSLFSDRSPLSFVTMFWGIALVLVLVGMLSFAFSSNPAIPSAPVLPMMAQGCLVVGCWMAAQHLGTWGLGRKSIDAVTSGMIAGLFVAHFAGVAFKHLLGYDEQTVTLVMVVLLAVLAVGFVLGAIGMTARASAAMREQHQQIIDLAESGLVVERAKETVRSSNREALDTFGLTEREMDLALLLVRGATMEAAAKQLGISVNTVRFHSKGIYAKAGVSSKRALQELVAAGGVRPGEKNGDNGA